MVSVRTLLQGSLLATGFAVFYLPASAQDHYGYIRPLLVLNCLVCHGDEGPGPLRLVEASHR